MRLTASACEAAATGWSSAAVPMIGYAFTLLGMATTPVAVAWLTKLVIDGLTGTASLSELLGLAAGLAGTGVVAATLPHASRYLGGQIGRAIAVTTTDRLFAATARFPGLRPFEDPRFLDRLRLAQEGTSRADGIVTEAFGLVRSAVTVIGFVGSVLVISPAMTLIVLCAAVPALIAQLKLSRRLRPAREHPVEHDIEDHEKRDRKAQRPDSGDGRPAAQRCRRRLLLNLQMHRRNKASGALL
ncbi:hypothetical protein [Nonomuraea sp. B19D2]|uniref:hypothetical protein n=1 Tax=Nonomuraea sp. B19D2 TaxID=3159561 RepID=UPI0032DAE794